MFVLIMNYQLLIESDFCITARSNIVCQNNILIGLFKITRTESFSTFLRVIYTVSNVFDWPVGNNEQWMKTWMKY